jgi:DNA-binding transcriptional ArsR family regulator
MEELADTFVVNTLDQLRSLSDPLRIRILEQLVRRPMTMSQLGEVFGETTAKMHYHVRELEKFGFITLVEKRERGGFIEKYYRAVARDVQVAPDLLRTSPPSEIARTTQDYFETLSREVLHVMTSAVEQPDASACLSITDETLWLTAQEFEEVQQQIKSIIKPYQERRHLSGEQRWLLHFIAHTHNASIEKQEEGQEPFQSS